MSIKTLIDNRVTRVATPLGLLSGLMLFGGNALAASGAADFAVEDIKTNRVACGSTCRNPVDVIIKNRGGNLNGGYSLQITLNVKPGARSNNARSYKQTIRVPKGGQKKTVTFDGIAIPTCYSGASVFEAKAVLIGGNYQDPNTRNNEKSVARTISKRCKQQGSNNGNGGNNGNGNGQKTTSLPDLMVSNIRSPDKLCYGDKANIVVSVKNQSQNKVNKTIPVSLTVEGPNGSQTYTENLSRGLGANRSSNLTFRNVEIKQGGKYSLYAQADANNDIKESNENNNTKQTSVRTSGPCASNNNGAASGPADYEIVSIDTQNVKCGTQCSLTNKAKVLIRNNGRSPGGGYSLLVNLHYTPAGDTANSKRLRKTIPAPGAGQQVAVTFDRINIPSCYQVASVFDAKIDLTGGDYIEGNKRNNQKTEAVVIKNRCR